MPEETRLPQEPELESVEPEAADEAVCHAVGDGVPILGVPDAAEAVPLEVEPEPEPEPVESSAPVPETAVEVAEDLSEPVPVATLVLEKKHPLAIRWMHWVNFPVLFTMIWTGILIYWNDSDNAYQHPHQVYRIGIGPITLFRFFPEWFYKSADVPYHVTQGLGYHFFFMWIFALNGVAYVAFLLWSKEWKFMVPTRASVGEAIQVTLVDLRLRKGLPPQTKYNGAQRIAYTGVIAMGFGSLATGLAIYKPTEAHWLTTLLGGYEMGRWFHFLLTIGFCGFFLVHVGQVALAGWNNFRAMVSGYEIRRVGEPSGVLSVEAERSRF